MSQHSEEPQPRPFQFGIGTILIVTTLGAIIVAGGRLMDAPVVMQVGISAYFFVLLLYIAFRVPYLLRISFGKDSQWQRVQQKRKALEAISKNSPADAEESESD